MAGAYRGGSLPVVVQKYGGSSVADMDRLKRVAARIQRTRALGYDVVAVVSAMGNTTSELIALAAQVTDEPDRRELDMLISVGERISMALLAMALRDQGIAARSLTGSQSGIITDESHADARVVEVRPARVRAVLDAGQVAIVAGFQGVSREREVTTLGRGGSDTTAVVLAAALGADYCEICSDVDGVYSADPRVVPEAVRLDALSLDEALALARGGAKVLFEDAVRYARDRGVRLQATATFGPGAGTRLTTERVSREGAAAVTADAALLALRIPPHLPDTFTALQEAGARFRRRVGDVWFVDVRNMHGGLPVLSANVKNLGKTAIVTAVGSQLGERPWMTSRAHRSLGDRGWLAEHWGSGGDSAWWQVDRSRVDDAVRCVHRDVVPTPR